MPAPDYFEFLGLPRKLNLDQADLQRRFYALSRELHPDRFSRATPAERERALSASALLNDAYRTLRDPISRAEYLLGGTGNSEQPPPELLEEVFEANEAVADSDAAAIAAARERFSALLAETDASLAALFAQCDAGDAAAEEVRAMLGRRRFLKKLVERLDNV
jgi:molecular chaperone HscB